LTLHLKAKHGIDTEEYRAEFPDAGYLVSDDIRLATSRRRYDTVMKEKRHLRKDEIDYIQKNFARLTSHQLARDLGLTARVVQNAIVKHVEICFPEGEFKEDGNADQNVNLFRAWSSEEIDWLTKNFSDHSLEALAAKLGRTKGAVHQRLQHLGLSKRDDKPFTRQEMAFIKKNADIMTTKEIAKHLSRHHKRVFKMIRALGIEKKKPHSAIFKNWTDAELNFVKKNIDRMTWEEMARRLGKNSGMVEYAAKYLGIKKKLENYWSDEEVAFLKKNHAVMTVTELCRELGKSRFSITHKTSRLGLKKKK